MNGLRATAVRLTLTLVALGTTLGAQAPSTPKPASPLTVTHAARAVAPGELILLTITAARPASSFSGTAFGKPLAIFPGDSAERWHALVAIDLGVSPGRVPVTVEARGTDGRVMRVVHQLTVAPKKFGVRRLRVPEKFVTPPASALARIAREQKRLGEVYAASANARFWQGAFETPTDGAPVSPFGVRSEYNGKQGSPHRGTDFAGATGAGVRAPNSGRVVLAEDLYYSGNTVIIDHGLGLFSVLMHLLRMDVQVGDRVTRGAAVGAVGATGRVTGPHLHWSVRLGAISVDPLSVLEVTARAGQPSPPR